MEQKNLLSSEQVVADHLEEKCISLVYALEELGLDTKLANETDFCNTLDFYIFCCSDCGYWRLPCLMHENDKGEEVCEHCEPDEK